MLINCQNCGQSNAERSNFCRFCGLKFGHPVPGGNQSGVQRGPQPQPQRQRESYEERQPKPYSWKTDEFQIKDTSARPTTQIKGHNQQQQMMRPAVGSHTPHKVAGYRCPRCATTLMPQSERKISSAGWIVFAVLLVFFFPLFWIGLLMKEDILTCPICNLRLS